MFAGHTSWFCTENGCDCPVNRMISISNHQRCWDLLLLKARSNYWNCFKLHVCFRMAAMSLTKGSIQRVNWCLGSTDQRQVCYIQVYFNTFASLVSQVLPVFWWGMVLCWCCCNITRSHLMKTIVQDGLTSLRWPEFGGFRGFNCFFFHKEILKQIGEKNIWLFWREGKMGIYLKLQPVEIVN